MVAAAAAVVAAPLDRYRTDWFPIPGAAGAFAAFGLGLACLLAPFARRLGLSPGRQLRLVAASPLGALALLVAAVRGPWEVPARPLLAAGSGVVVSAAALLLLPWAAERALTGAAALYDRLFPPRRLSIRPPPRRDA